MKNIFIIAGTALLTLAACSHDEVRDLADQQLIDFRLAVDTRATETTTNNIESFFVTALNEDGEVYYTNVEYSDGDSDGIFVSTFPFYWPASGSLTFYAYSPGASALGGTVAITKESKTLTSFTTATQLAEQVDFITASATGSRTDNANGVALEFGHRLSQIEVQARNVNTGYVYSITGVKIGKVASTGDYDFATGEWSNWDDVTDFVSEYRDAITLNSTAQSIMGAGGNAMLIPQELTGWDNSNDKPNSMSGSFFSVKVNIQTKSGLKVFPKEDDVDYGWVAVPVSYTLEAGYKYIFTLDFTNGAGQTEPDGTNEPIDILGDPIKFSMDTEVTEWTTEV